MSWSHGPGIPLTFRCAKCKVGRTYQGINLEATGKSRKRSDHDFGRIGKRHVQYKCLDCGHVGWSKHIEANRLLEALEDKS